MDTHSQNPISDEQMQYWQRTHRRGRVIGGIMVIGAGLLLLAKQLGALIPEWVFTWQMLLIAIGVFVGLKHGFRKLSWIALVLVGGIFMMREFWPELMITHYLWPIGIILFGLAILLKPRSKYFQKRWHKYHRYHEHSMHNSSEDYLDVNAILGGVKKNVITKTFKGGDIHAVMGGAEINLTQADFTGQVELELNAIMGGVKLIVPAHWEIKSELNAVLGGVEDKRPIIHDPSMVRDKVLVLRGSAVLGGIELASY